MSLEIKIGVPDRQWTMNDEVQVISIAKTPLLFKNSKVLTLGSCFAEMIKGRLAAMAYTVLPDYGFPYDKNRIRIANVELNHLNHYHTYSLRQEFEKAAGIWHQSDDDYWQIADDGWEKNGLVFQDPYRRRIIGRDINDVRAATKAIDSSIKSGIEQADLFLITLGLIEVWRKKDNGRYACAGPGWENGGGKGQLSFHLSSFQENHENISAVIDFINKIKPQAAVVLTVSPVPLAKTRTENCAVIANAESKAILRAVAGQICRERDNVHYFPSYEIAMNSVKPFREDGRHVRPEIAQTIAEAFIAAFGAE